MFLRKIFCAGFLLFGFCLSAQAQVYRCGNAYSSKPCPGGKEVDVSPPLSDPAGPKSVQIYLCRTPGGKLYWLHERCANRGWTLDRIEWVPKGLDWDDQVEYARDKRNAARANAAPVISGGSSSQSSGGASASNKAFQCDELNRRVNWLDGLGRAGGSGYTMDWIREERRLARDKQYRLGC